MQSRQPAYGPAVQVHRAGEAALTGGDAWSRSAGLVIVAIAVVGVLFVGALLLMYFGSVQSGGARDAVAARPAEAASMRAPPIAPALAPAAVAAASARPMAAAEPHSRRAAAPGVGVAPAPEREKRTGMIERAPRATPVEREPRAAPSPEPEKHTATIEREQRAAPDERETRRQRVVEPAPSAAPENTKPAAAAAPAADRPERTDSPVTPPAPLAAPSIPAPVPASESMQLPVAAVAAPPPRQPPETRAEPAAEALPPVVLRPVSRRQPDFPLQALRAGVTRGSVLAQVTVATDGSVSAVTIVASHPPRLFDRAAQDALAEWRFQPIPRPATAQIEVLFRDE
jgi:TonB family protein